jgi:hypothetical protein
MSRHTASTGTRHVGPDPADLTLADLDPAYAEHEKRWVNGLPCPKACRYCVLMA